MKLQRPFFAQNTLDVAQSLLGKFIIRKINRQTLIGKIVETEAYCGFNDLASHAHKGKTDRNAIMFGQAGYAYIYFVYGMYHCFNIVTGQTGYPAAVLIRAVEPIAGQETMMSNRKTVDLKNLCSGPAKFCQAFKLTRKESGIDLVKSSEIWLDDRAEKILTDSIVKRPRIGVAYAKHCARWPRRFYLKNNLFVSKPN